MSSVLRILSRTKDDSSLVASFIHGRTPGTQRVYGSDVRAFLAWANKPVQLLKAVHLRAYIEACRKMKNKPATIHRKTVIVRSFFAFLNRERELLEDPMARVDVPPVPPPGKPRTLTTDQVKAFFEQTSGTSVASMRDRALYLLMSATGLRLSEARDLSLRDIGESEEQGWKTLRVLGKGEKEREIHVRPEVWAVSLHYLQRRTEFMDESSPLFAAVPRARPIKAQRTDRRMSCASIYGRFKRLAKKAGLSSEVSPHALRHYFACEADSGGASVEAIRQALGHAGLGTTQRYLMRVRKGLNEAFVRTKVPKVAI